MAITTVDVQGAQAQFPIAFTTSYKMSGMCDNNPSGGYFHAVIWYDRSLTEAHFACIGHGDFYAGSANIIMIGY